MALAKAVGPPAALIARSMAFIVPPILHDTCLHATGIVESVYTAPCSVSRMELKDRIKLARTLAKLSQTALATACGWQWGSRIGNYEQGTNEPTIDDLRRIARETGADETWLITGEGGMSAAPKRDGFLRPISVWNDTADLPPESTVLFPKLDYYLSAGNGGPDPSAVEQTDKALPFSASWAKAKGWTPKTHFTMRAIGSSMEPTIQNNAPVVIDTSAKAIRSGKVYAVLIDGEPLLKRLVKLPNGRVQVQSDNSAREYAPYEVAEDEVHVIGRAVWTPSEL